MHYILTLHQISWVFLYRCGSIQWHTQDDELVGARIWEKKFNIEDCEGIVIEDPVHPSGYTTARISRGGGVP